MIKRQTKDAGLGGLISEATTHGVDYPTPVNFSYAYGFGFLALICLVIQILTGIFLAMHYAAHVDLAFNSVEHVMRDVQSGQIIRYLHANGASMFFIVVYLHIFRGLYYSSYAYPRAHLQNSGVMIFLIMMGTGFLGYVLPQGQMSLQGATVITNLISAVPLVGDSIVYQVQGGFSVDNPTLNRIFSIHYTLPFVLAGLIGVHIILLHDKGSSNPLGGESVSYISFHPYLQVKDFVGFMALVSFMVFLVFFTPNALGHPDNYIPANPMVTPLILFRSSISYLFMLFCVQFPISLVVFLLWLELLLSLCYYRTSTRLSYDHQHSDLSLRWFIRFSWPMDLSLVRLVQTRWSIRTLKLGKQPLYFISRFCLLYSQSQDFWNDKLTEVKLYNCRYGEIGKHVSFRN